MALGKNNKRVRRIMGDNCHFKFGDPASWVQPGKSNRWGLFYDIGDRETTFADGTVGSIEGDLKARIEIDIAQTHPEELAFIDDLRESETKIEFWGDAKNVDGDDCEVYVPEAIVVAAIKMESPASDNIKYELILKIQPQAEKFEVQDVDLPTASKHGGTPVESKNVFFNYYVAIPD